MEEKKKTRPFTVKNGITVYDNYSPPREEGVHHRLMCLTGETKGVSYIMKLNRITIGRGETSSIAIDNSSLSRNHAELTKIGDEYIITDLGSHNGIVINDLKVKQHTLMDNDKIILGNLVLKYNRLTIEKGDLTQVIDSKNKDWAKKSKGQVKTSKGSSETSQKDDDKEKAKKKRIYMLVGLILLGVLFLDEGEDGGKGEEQGDIRLVKRDLVDDKVQNYINSKQEKLDKEVETKLNEIFLRGLREEREGNYYRAMNEFNLALIISPGNARANYYLSKTKQKIEKEIKTSMLSAKNLKRALRYKAAQFEYCNVVRLLQYNQEDENYKHALEGIKAIEKEMGLDEGAINCL